MVNRRPTTTCQKDPSFYVEPAVNFIVYLGKLQEEKKFDKIYAADETAVFLDCADSITVEQKGVPEVSICFFLE